MYDNMETIPSRSSLRGRSFDSTYLQPPKKTSNNSRSRSCEHHTSPTAVVSVTREEIDLNVTPLSSLRSCSEFQRKLSSRSSFHIESAMRMLPVSSNEALSSSASTSSNSIHSNKSPFSKLSLFGKNARKSRLHLSAVQEDEKDFLVQKMASRGCPEYEHNLQIALDREEREEQESTRHLSRSRDGATSPSRHGQNRLASSVRSDRSSADDYHLLISDADMNRFDPRSVSVSSHGRARQFSESAHPDDRYRARYNSHASEGGRLDSRSISNVFNGTLSFVFGVQTRGSAVDDIPAGCCQVMEIELKPMRSRQIVRVLEPVFETNPEISSYSSTMNSNLGHISSHSSHQSFTGLTLEPHTHHHNHNDSDMYRSPPHTTRQNQRDSTVYTAADTNNRANYEQLEPLGFNFPIPNRNAFPVLYAAVIRLRRMPLRVYTRRVLALARNLAALCPWMLTLEVNEEWAPTYHVALPAAGDDELYAQLRLQPFVFGYYIRAMLWAGYGGFIFHSYSLLSWQHEVHRQLEPNLQLIVCAAHVYLLAQLLLNVLLLTPRLVVHLQCWSCSHSQDSEESLERLRALLHSEVWQAGRLLGQVQDGLSVLFLLLAQVALILLGAEISGASSVRELLVSLCSTVVFMLGLRLAVATIYSVSCNDPVVIGEARRRGLRKVDVEALPTFVYSAEDEVNNLDCSICLNNFERGEMLVSLQCHQRHSFHAGCIREWLVKQNSCPLCQKCV